MYDQMSLLDLPSATFLQVLESGAWPCALPASVTIPRSGQVPALASLSHRQAKALGLTTSGTCGPHGNTSSASAALQLSLESRLRQKLSSLGSTLYTQTWKPWVTPLGVSRLRLRVSVRRTSETERTGLQLPVSPRVTPAARDWKDSAADIAPRADGKERFDQLPRQANLAGWPTPTANCVTGAGSAGRDGGLNIQSAAVLAGWPTPSCSNDREARPVLMIRLDGSKNQQRLQDFSAIAGPARLTASGELLTGSTAGMESGGQLNPELPRWLMACPEAWAQCHPNYSDWQSWQAFLATHSNAPNSTEPAA